ncbi:MAG: hypothetical protein LBT64_00130 [Puniceicoccales bacterium]|jgi:hypothetical protein|nr:hypothetical protein [Puniceicoccales bacterium]
MVKVEGILEKLQNAIENRLLSLNELRNVPILTHKQSDLSSVIESGARSGIGTMIFLMPPVPGYVQQHIAGPVFDSATIEVKIVENIAANATERTLLFLAEAVMRHLHMWAPNAMDENYRLKLAAGPDCCRVTCDDGINSFSMRFTIPCHLKATTA